MAGTGISVGRPIVPHCVTDVRCIHLGEEPDEFVPELFEARVNALGM